MSGEFVSEKLRPPKPVEEPREYYRWRYRVFELLNGIQTILASGIEISPAPVGQIPGVTLQDMASQLDALLTELQTGGYNQSDSRVIELERKVSNLEKVIVGSDQGDQRIIGLEKKVANLEKLLVMEV